MTILTKCVTLLEDGVEVQQWLRTPTPFAMEQYLRLIIEADIDLNTVMTPYLDPDLILLTLSDLEKAPRDVRRTAEHKALVAKAKADVETLSELSQEDLAGARKYAAKRRAESGLERMVISSAILAALLSDASPRDVSGRPTRIYSREEAQQMVPLDSYEELYATVSELWPSGEATPGNPEAGTENGSPTPTNSTATS